jgi:hypothetical protein
MESSFSSLESVLEPLMYLWLAVYEAEQTTKLVIQERTRVENVSNELILIDEWENIGVSSSA